ncbi:MAG: LPXTG cell wall anchor domain-containing protein [Acidimicrobiia bacterium]
MTTVGSDPRGGRVTTRRIRAVAGALFVTAGLALSPMVAFADGTETLGPPSITLASGTGVAAGGVGMVDGAGSLTLTVPADATVKQVILYWEGQYTDDAAPATLGTDTINVDGNSVTGKLIGGPTLFFDNVTSVSYRADITSLDVVKPGANSITMSGLNFSYRSNGAGIFAIYSQPGAPPATIGLRDGNDLAFINFAAPLDTTVPQTFTYNVASVARTATLSLFASSVEDNRHRPNVVRVRFDNGTVQDIVDPFSSNNGLEWDTAVRTVTVPAGTSSFTAQALSAPDQTPDLPASFAWIGLGLAIPDAPSQVTTTVPPTTQPLTTQPPTAAATTLVSSAPTTPGPTDPPSVAGTTIVQTLPATGASGSSNAIASAAVLLVLAGVTLLIGARRQPARVRVRTKR